MHDFIVVSLLLNWLYKQTANVGLLGIILIILCWCHEHAAKQTAKLLPNGQALTLMWGQ